MVWSFEGSWLSALSVIQPERITFIRYVAMELVDLCDDGIVYATF